MNSSLFTIMMSWPRAYQNLSFDSNITVGTLSFVRLSKDYIMCEETES